MMSNRSFMTAGVAAVLLAFVLAGQVHAHDTDQGPHGGLSVVVKGHHVELTTKDSEIKVYLTDEAHAEMSSKGASGRAVILDGSKQSTVPLVPVEPNALTGQLGAPLTAGARVVVSIKFGDGHDVLARFVLK